MADIESAHLCAAPAAGRGHCEAHLVVDIHERQRPGGIGSGSRHVCAARPQSGEFVSDSASSLERQASLMHLVQDVVHRIADRAGHRAVDGRRGRLVFERTGIRGNAAGRNRAVTQRPQKRFVPLLAQLDGLHVRQRTRDALVGIVHGLIDGRPVFRDQPIFLVPDVIRRFLERNTANTFGLYFDHRIHGY